MKVPNYAGAVDLNKLYDTPVKTSKSRGDMSLFMSSWN